MSEFYGVIIFLFLTYSMFCKYRSRNQFFSNGCLPHEILRGMKIGDKIFIGETLVEVIKSK